MILVFSGVKTLQNVIMYSAEAFIKCTNDKIKRMEASVNHLDESSKKLAQHNKQLEKQLGVSHCYHTRRYRMLSIFGGAREQFYV